MIGSRKWPWAVGLVVLLFILAPRLAQVYVDGLWFDSLGYAAVYWYSFGLKWGLFAGFFALTFLILRGAFWALERAFAGYELGGSVMRFDNQPLEMEPDRFIRPVAWGLPIFWGLLVGLSMMSRWDLFALYFNGRSSGNPDPLLNKPLGFFLFSWPVHQVLASWLTGLAIIIFIATLLFGVFAFTSRMPRIIKDEALRTASLACSLALAAVLVVYAWRFYLGRFSQLWRDQEIFTGAGYTQANILLPGLLLVAFTLLGAATLAILNALLWRRPRIVALALAIPLVTYIGLSLVTNYVTSFVVRPNELERQSPYIKHNIEGTRRAFGLDRMEARAFPAENGVAAFDLTQNRTALDNIRLWDWQALQSTLRQVQVLRTYYDFPDVDVDRYRINGRLRQVMIAARELDVDRLPPASRNWVNDRLVYTHGYGVTMNTADGFTPEGRPRFLLSNVPVRSTVPEIKLTRPEIYFGQKTDTHVYVKTRQKEFDFPQGETNAYTTYEGTGGVTLGGFARRWLLSWALGDLSKIPFSNDITPDSRVLMYRNIQERVQRIAPFLTYDNDPYVVVGNDGRLYWIMDAYTSSIYYPYSRHYQAGNQWTNYMRNSVKVVVDAYNGTANYYVFDTQDPIIQAYRGAFPSLFRDAGEMPAGLLEHVRYPELLFRTQADVYGLYHMQDVRLFFGREDVWSVAGEGTAPSLPAMLPPGLAPGQGQGQGQGPNFGAQTSTQNTVSEPLDPYYVLISLPGEKTGEEFVQILPFTPSNRKNMIGWMAGRSNTQGHGTLLSYDFPKAKQVTGPEQFRARINQNSYLSERITLWNQQGSTVLRGNLLAIPLGRGLLYVQPIFLQANQSGMPELRLVVLGTQERIAYGTDFREALTKLLSGDATPTDEDGQGITGEGVTQSGMTQSGITGATQTPPASAQPGTSVPAGVQPPTGVQPPAGAAANRQQLINRAADDLEAYQRLTAQGRYSEAGQRLEAVRSTLDRLRRQGQ
ncbi:MAG TPA: UPF0182 family protein [Abditibacteriaceae bacterium]|jgi:hypothetical protein